MDSALAYLLARDVDGLPSEAAQPWTQVGAGTVTRSPKGYRLTKTSLTQRLIFWRPLFEADQTRRRRRRRHLDDVELQLEAEARSFTGDPSGIAMLVDDGVRAVALSIGAPLRLVDPYTLDTLLEMPEHAHWAGQHVYHLVKRRSATWEVYVDGVLAGRLPYEATPTAKGRPTQTGWVEDGLPIAAWGHLDPSSEGDATFDRIEAGLNTPLPPQWKVEQTRTSMLIGLQTRWTRLAEAFLRSTTLLAEMPRRAMEGAWQDLGAARLDVERHTYSGAALPDEEDTPWTLLEAEDVAVERQRVRLSGQGLAPTGAEVAFSAPVYTETPEYAAGTTFTLRSSEGDAYGRVGPAVRVEDGARVAMAQMLTDDGIAHRWALTGKAVTGPVTELGLPWPVNPWRPHRVEVVMLAPDWVYLLVDGQLVDRIAYDACDAAPA